MTKVSIATVTILGDLDAIKQELLDTGRAFTVVNASQLVERDLRPVLDGGSIEQLTYRGMADGRIRFTAMLTMPWFSPRMREDYVEGAWTPFDDPPALKSEYLRAMDEAAERFGLAINSKITVDGITLLKVWRTRSTIDSEREYAERVQAAMQRIASLSPEEVAAGTFMQAADRALMATGLRTEEGELYSVVTLDEEGRCLSVTDPMEYPLAYYTMRGGDHKTEFQQLAPQAF
ncbi:hypothetical protein GOB57_07915 [Sinorhizobium meliloti]|nr:hypothetical protein [Sinorhizobium meliloti]